MGSNWPSGIDGRNPRPGVVMVQRLDGRRLLADAGRGG
jgi:secreted PhoX family phosphatase